MINNNDNYKIYKASKNSNWFALFYTLWNAFYSTVLAATELSKQWNLEYLKFAIQWK